MHEKIATVADHVRRYENFLGKNTFPDAVKIDETGLSVKLSIFEEEIMEKPNGSVLIPLDEYLKNELAGILKKIEAQGSTIESIVVYRPYAKKGWRADITTNEKRFTNILQGGEPLPLSEWKQLKKDQ